MGFVELRNVEAYHSNKACGIFFSFLISDSSVTARIIPPIQHVSVLDFQHIKSKISKCAPLVFINMELEQQDQIQIKKRGYLPLSGINLWREKERDQ